MIARVYGSEVACWTPDNEAALRQCGQFAAYGADHDFLRFYADDRGNRLSIFENAATLAAVDDAEEMRLFLTMDPTVNYVRTDRRTAARIAEQWQSSYQSEAVMQAPPCCTVSDLIEELPLREQYEVMLAGFGQEHIPPFETWYADVHHRYRRGLCRAIGVHTDEGAMACAMTVAECQKAALIGAVATRPEARGRGFASACVLSLAAFLQKENKKVLLSPKNNKAHRLYEHIGFTVVGEWGSVEKPK